MQRFVYESEASNREKTRVFRGVGGYDIQRLKAHLESSPSFVTPQLYPNLILWNDIIVPCHTRCPKGYIEL